MPSGHKPKCISSVMPLAYSAQGNNAHPYRPQGNRTVFTLLLTLPAPRHSLRIPLLLQSVFSHPTVRLAVCLSICSTGRLYDDDVSGASATELYECKLRSRPSWNLECCRAVRAVYAIQSSADRHLMMELVRATSSLQFYVAVNSFLRSNLLYTRRAFPSFLQPLHPTLSLPLHVWYAPFELDSNSVRPCHTVWLSGETKTNRRSIRGAKVIKQWSAIRRFTAVIPSAGRE